MIDIDDVVDVTDRYRGGGRYSKVDAGVKVGDQSFYDAIISNNKSSIHLAFF